MPAVSQRTASRRRTINEINMVPFIDVMLVLLIIFMVTAPLITTGMIDLPSVGKSAQRPEHVIELVVESDESLRLRVDGKDSGDAVSMNSLRARVLQAQAGDAKTPVVISADKGVRYDVVVKAMDVLQRAGIERVGLSVKNGGG
ncbi:ExbD/TolR family protein [Piscinibacter koreensis]|uniref:ExbD/TolR family protein n=1 Tax=Piscinibacter koreensis TaxID=2742824 RepID=A0A7Y6TXN2_9BURK|nr:ExbD/TolR family protein [Schlegelella koreensis]NUZ07235.1 ExbD/TolR family protein [Schlegelella koreensis]